MPGADGNEDTGYVHSVYRSGDHIVALFYGHHCIHTISCTYTFILIILSYRRASKQSPEAIAENVMPVAATGLGTGCTAMKKVHSIL
jgi:hypothetical protein